MSRKSRTIFSFFFFFTSAYLSTIVLPITIYSTISFKNQFRGIEVITNQTVTPLHTDPSFYASFNLTHKKSADDFVPPLSLSSPPSPSFVQKRYPPRSFLSSVHSTTTPIKENKREQRKKRDNKKENKERKGGKEIKGRKSCVNGVHSMSKTSPPVFHPRGRWRGQDRKHRPAERIFFSAPRNSSLTRHPRSCNLLYTYTHTHAHIYIYIFSIRSRLHNGRVSPVPFTQWNRLHRTGIYHRILERGSSYKSGALVKFLLASKRRLPFTVHPSTSPFSGPRLLAAEIPLSSGFHSLPPIRIHLTDFGDRLGGETIGSSFIYPAPAPPSGERIKKGRRIWETYLNPVCVYNQRPTKATCEQPFPNFLCIPLFFTSVRSFVSSVCFGSSDLFCQNFLQIMIKIYKSRYNWRYFFFYG